MASSQCALQGVIALYSNLAQNPDKDFGWDKGLTNARNHGYKEEWTEKLPLAMWDYCAAVGNPFELGEFPKGSTVLDLGCGAGVDLCVASLLVGESGKAIGVDITPLMVETARRHAKEAGLSNVEVLEGNLEHLPVENESVDIVISNGAINLASSKPKVFEEIFRVLKPQGKLYFADMIDISEGGCATSCCAQSVSEGDWANCVEGTLKKEALTLMMSEAGFVNIECTGTNHYTTAPTTAGATFRSTKGDGNVKQRHWENVYTTKDMSKVGWYQKEPSISLALLQKIGSTPKDAIIDVGCGVSTLSDRLIDLGYRDISLLDISSSALEIVKKRLGASADIPVYHVGDVCTFASDKQFDVWHDRAVFHFLQKEEEQHAYMDTLYRSLSPDGHAIIGTFAVDGPDSCSALPVRQYNKERMENCIQGRFELIDLIDETHITPGGSEQKYCFFILKSVKD
ncbi:class I SAM-dependent methyltransferase [Sulfuricurvum sp.]|uniref:class I SAM-dependent methyltransferase n=1 Tax=Sulfuricurvum sp. TaxID=2025608 RepID=UPI0026275BBD|nr:class I SAM-dependent methyltransferase [Sulfuricurvum sp.]MDD2267098.1 methyltransferase domain-containing protein [Sulfuricurvum sp.]MDD2782741.1 methyltransferase domain-containing protein [Sulfuricurvum sp.]